MNIKNNCLTDKEILENKELLEEISKIDGFNIDELDIWLEENEMRVYRDLGIDVYLDSHFACYHTEVQDCIDRGDYYEIVPPFGYENCYPEKELKIKKDSIAEVIDSNNCYIIEVNGKTYYVCLEE